MVHDIRIEEKTYNNTSRKGQYWYIKAPKVHAQILKKRDQTPQELRAIYRSTYLTKPQQTRRKMEAYLKKRGTQQPKADNLIQRGNYQQELHKPTNAHITKFYERAAQKLKVPKQHEKRVIRAMKRHTIRHSINVRVYGIPKGGKNEVLLMEFWDIGQRNAAQAQRHYLTNTTMFSAGAPITYDADRTIQHYARIPAKAIKKYHPVGTITQTTLRVSYTK